MSQHHLLTPINFILLPLDKPRSGSSWATPPPSFLVPFFFLFALVFPSPLSYTLPILVLSLLLALKEPSSHGSIRRSFREDDDAGPPSGLLMAGFLHGSEGAQLGSPAPVSGDPLV